MKVELYPYLFEPIYRDYLWGGDRLARLYGRKGTPDPCAESWEVADRPDAVSRVARGPCRGRTLRELIEADAAAILGAAVRTDRFPLLVKIIDARRRLSLQVHPNEETALVTGGEPKSEMWYALPGGDADAQVYCGLRPEVDRAAFEAALRRGEVEKTLNRFTAVPGCAIDVPGGRVHAIAEGCLLLEVQQNSDTTYRVHDWDRVDRDGRARELHVEQALQVIRWDDHPPRQAKAPMPWPESSGNRGWEILVTPFFALTAWDVRREDCERADGRACRMFFCESGRVALHGGGQDAVLEPGRTCLLPAGLENCRIVPLTEQARLIRIAV
jgi:mannose-6-phosphate isomerase